MKIKLFTFFLLIFSLAPILASTSQGDHAFGLPADVAAGDSDDILVPALPDPAPSDVSQGSADATVPEPDTPGTTSDTADSQNTAGVACNPGPADFGQTTGQDDDAAAPHCSSGGSDPGEPPNYPPSFVNFNPPNQAIATELYAYDVEATDPEGEPLTFELTGYPDNMTIDPGTGLIEWTATELQIAQDPYDVTVWVSDSKNSVDASYSLLVVQKQTVSNPAGGGGLTVGVATAGGGIIPTSNSSSPTTSTQENHAPEFQAPTPPSIANATWLYVYTFNVADAEGDPIVFELTSAPEGVSILPAYGTIFWVPTLEQVRSEPYAVIVRASDGEKVNEFAFSVTVQAPAFILGTSRAYPEEPATPLPEPKRRVAASLSRLPDTAYPLPELPFGMQILSPLMAGFPAYGSATLLLAYHWTAFLLQILLIILALALVTWLRSRIERRNTL